MKSSLHIYKSTSFFASLLLLVASCGQNEDFCSSAPKVESGVSITFNRLEKELFACQTKAEVVGFLTQYPTYSNYFLNKYEYRTDSAFVNSVFRLVTDPYVDTIYNDVMKQFEGLDDLKLELEDAFSRVKHYYPNFNVPKIQTGITGFGTDLYVSDSLVIIGLDYFLGRFGTFRPRLPEYIVKRLEPEYIVPNIILHLSRYYNEQELSNKAFLADMIFYGKSYYWTKTMLPCLPDSLIIQYTTKELELVNEYDEVVWAYVVENELLYETNHFLKRKFLEERPDTPELGSEFPGRIGAWLGYEVVKSFMRRNEDTKLVEMMNIQDPNEIFARSKYKPSID